MTFVKAIILTLLIVILFFINVLSLSSIIRYILQQFHLYESDSPELFPLKYIVFLCVEIIIFILIFSL